ncbi:MAG: arsenosugar biosynthesis radical SAM protein ArsS [Planctomycetes bacterium]|nr:arsenosugar biosynthesis radical SAM protein ArsS [Planctomycetota bacterium]MCB9919157.1 arsenosugar biosynthesis radical SAM protein ArsS [Planctomycetota bacterium]
MTEHVQVPTELQSLRRSTLSTLQLNLGRYCNLACTHCHVDAGPGRRERMSAEVRERVIEWIRLHRPSTVDLTGGAPELIPGFREIVIAAREVGAIVLDRCNLLVLLEPGQEDLVDFLAEHRVQVVASLPCYLKDNVDRQRGRGVFDGSIEGLQRLNRVGYGRRRELGLQLVYNPTGAGLPSDQHELEAAYRERLRDDWGIEFTGLWCLANVPIQRYRGYLERSGGLAPYEALLRDAFNPATLDHLMCRTTLSVDHEGRLFDCDFHLALNRPLGGRPRAPMLWDLDPRTLDGRPVPTGTHCLACTAGSGSSCTGHLV